MKRISYMLLLPLSIILISVGCSDWFDINEDPNRPEDVSMDQLLSGATGGSAYVHGGWYFNLGGFWAQHYTQSTGASQWAMLEKLDLNTSDFNRQWQGLYANSIKDFEILKQKAVAANEWGYYLIATCIQSYDFHVLADLYDQIPFSEALMGEDNYSPKYEQGSAIADSLLARITYAQAKYEALGAVSNPGKQDVIFGGDYDKWMQFANTLKLKICLRSVNVAPTKHTTLIQSLLTENNFLGDNAAMSGFRDQVNARNPFYETFIDRLSGNVVASATLFDFLDNSGDERFFEIYNPAPLGGYQALGQGRYLNDQSIYSNYESLSGVNVGKLQPVYYFTLAEVDFLLAEAEARYGSAANAQAHYETGINDSYDFFGLTSDPDMYAADSIYAYNGVESIIVQKWIAAANCHPLEAFFDYNRTGYPNIFTISPINAWNKTPQRLLFPDNERRRNKNTPMQQPVYTKVWWAK